MIRSDLLFLQEGNVFKRIRRCRFLAILLILSMEAPEWASAADSNDIEALFKQGTELRRQGRDAEALAEFQKVASLQDSPRAEGQMAFAEQALGLWGDAHTHISKALEQSNDPWIQKNRAVLDGAQGIIRSHLCLVEIWGSPAGAEVFVDGKPVGVLPSLSIWMEAGAIPILVKAKGYTDLVKTLKTSEGYRLREHIDLRRYVVAQEIAPPLVEARSSALPVHAEASVPEVQASKQLDNRDMTPSAAGDEAPVYKRWWFWTLIGAGVAAAGTTALLLTQGKNTGPTCVSSPCTTWGN